MSVKNPNGRPVNPQATPALMQAARKLVSEHGYQAVSMQMIADAAGVGRQTVYRRWPSKAGLIFDAYLEHAQKLGEIADGPVACMLTRFLTQLFEGLEEDGLAVRSFIAAAQEDADFRESFNERFIRPRDGIMEAILQRGVQRGELPQTADLALLVEMIHGAFWYRLLLGKSLSHDYAVRLADISLGPLLVSGDRLANIDH
jgi:AcrR family transcriptional regulator